MIARRVPMLPHWRHSLAVILLCGGLVILLAPINRGSARASVLGFDARQLDAANTGAEVSLLRQAYVRLSIGNHDYKGHRVKAMKAVAAACDVLGTDIRGDAKDHEVQPASDDQLKGAETIIEQVQQLAQNADQADVVDHLKKAIDEINTALSVK